MATTKGTIQLWLNRGKSEGYDYMIVVCDTYDFEDYPVYASEENFASEYDRMLKSSMQKIMEVYNLHEDFKGQLAEYRAFHHPQDFDPNAPRESDT